MNILITILLSIVLLSACVPCNNTNKVHKQNNTLDSWTATKYNPAPDLRNVVNQTQQDIVRMVYAAGKYQSNVTKRRQFGRLRYVVVNLNTDNGLVFNGINLNGANYIALASGMLYIVYNNNTIKRFQGGENFEELLRFISDNRR